MECSKSECLIKAVYIEQIFFLKTKCFQQPVSKESTSPLNLFDCKLTKRDTTKTKKRNIENLFERVMTYFLLINADKYSFKCVSSQK